MSAHLPADALLRRLHARQQQAGALSFPVAERILAMLSWFGARRAFSSAVRDRHALLEHAGSPVALIVYGRAAESGDGAEPLVIAPPPGTVIRVESTLWHKRHAEGPAAVVASARATQQSAPKVAPQALRSPLRHDAPVADTLPLPPRAESPDAPKSAEIARIPELSMAPKSAAPARAQSHAVHAPSRPHERESGRAELLPPAALAPALSLAQSGSAPAQPRSTRPSVPSAERLGHAFALAAQLGKRTAAEPTATPAKLRAADDQPTLPQSRATLNQGVQASPSAPPVARPASAPASLETTSAMVSDGRRAHPSAAAGDAKSVRENPASVAMVDSALPTLVAEAKASAAMNATAALFYRSALPAGADPKADERAAEGPVAAPVRSRETAAQPVVPQSRVAMNQRTPAGSAAIPVPRPASMPAPAEAASALVHADGRAPQLTTAEKSLHGIPATGAVANGYPAVGSPLPTRVAETKTAVAMNAMAPLSYRATQPAAADSKEARRPAATRREPARMDLGLPAPPTASPPKSPEPPRSVLPHPSKVPPIDVERLTEQVHRRLLKELHRERERRGFIR